MKSPKQTAYSMAWRSLKLLMENCDTSKEGITFEQVYLLHTHLWLKKHAKHLRRYLNQFVGNGTAFRRKGGYVIKAKYMKLDFPKSRVSYK